MNATERQESQSSYVEMSPDAETVDDSAGDCSDYFCMEKRTDSLLLPQNDSRNVFKSNFLKFSSLLVSGHQICLTLKKSLI